MNMRAMKTTWCLLLGVSSLCSVDALLTASGWNRLQRSGRAVQRYPSRPTVDVVGFPQSSPSKPFDVRRQSKSSTTTYYSKNTNNLSQEQRRQESLNAGHNPLLSLNLNLDALARAQAPARAQELYQRIAALHREGYYAVSPDIVSFNSVLKAWQTDPVKALEFWEAEAVPGRMNVRSYNTFLLALAKAGMYESAESLLRQMLAINAAVRPDLISWNTVLLACATAICHDDDTIDTDRSVITETAERLLREMIHGGADNSSEESTPAALDTASKTDKRDFLTLPPVMDPHYIPPRPDPTSYNTVMATWAAHPDPLLAAQKAEQWLRELQARQHLESSYKKTTVQPDVYTYTIVLKAWSRCTGPEAVSRALQLFSEMCDSSTVQPNRVTYTVVMRTLCQNLQPNEASVLLQSMLNGTPDLRPDCVAFSVLLDGWARYAKDRAYEKDDVACRRAVESVQDLLQQMKKLSATWPDMAPNERTYTSVLKTLAASQLFEAGLLARDVLADMWKVGSHSFPTTIHYNAVLDCYARSPRATKAVDAALVWREMIEAGVTCDTITYNSVLNAAANSFGTMELKQTSLHIGLEAFEALQADTTCSPTSLTYNYYFKMIRRLGASTKDTFHLYQRGFDCCIAQGCLNEVLLRRLVGSLSANELKRLLGDKASIISALPKAWSRHALETLHPSKG